MPKELKWEKLNSSMNTFRAKVPGGWLVVVSSTVEGGLTFYPDPRHDWDGSSLP